MQNGTTPAAFKYNQLQGHHRKLENIKDADACSKLLSAVLVSQRWVCGGGRAGLCVCICVRVCLYTYKQVYVLI